MPTFSHWSWRQRRVLCAILIQQLLTYMCVSILAPFFPKEAARKGVNEVVIGFIFSVYALTSTILSPITGKYIIPAVGRKPVLLGGCWLSGGAVTLFGLLDRVEDPQKFVIMCFIVRIVQAAGVSMYITAGFAYLAVTFREDLGMVMGLSEMSVGIGFMLGPTVGGQLFQVGGYMLPFLVLGGITMLTLPISYFLLPRDEEDVTSTEDSSDDIVNECNPTPKLSESRDQYDVSISHAYADLTEPWTSSRTNLLHKNRAEIFERARRRRWSCRFLFFVSYVSLNAISISFYETTLEPHLRPLGLNAGRVGILFIVSSMFYFVFGVIVGWMTDALACRRAHFAILGMLLQSSAFLLLGPSPILGMENNVGMNIVALATIGTSFAFSLVPTFAILFDADEYHQPILKSSRNVARRYAVVAGVWQAAYSLGEFIGPSVGGVLLFYLGYPVASSVMSLLCLFSAFSLAVVDRVAPEEERLVPSDEHVMSSPRSIPQQDLHSRKAKHGLINGPGNRTQGTLTTVQGGNYGSVRRSDV